VAFVKGQGTSLMDNGRCPKAPCPSVRNGGCFPHFSLCCSTYLPQATKMPLEATIRDHLVLVAICGLINVPTHKGLLIAFVVCDMDKSTVSKSPESYLR
jgi:hypothetical protein